jgi:hypothetical protein
MGRIRAKINIIFIPGAADGCPAGVRTGPDTGARALRIGG